MSTFARRMHRSALPIWIAGATWLAAHASAQNAPSAPVSAQNTPTIDEFTDALQVAIDKGLEALAGMQASDGSFGGRFGRNVAITSLSALAFMADGNLPDRGKYASQVQGALDYVLSCSAESGLIADEAVTSPMYGHGFATLFLGEIVGMNAGGVESPESQRAHEALVKAVRLIERTQNQQGGWRYNPVPFDADVSVTICQVMGLRSARNAGLEVSSDVIDKAVKYVRDCQNPDGGFRYQLDPGMSGWARSAAGVATLYYAGIYEDKAIDEGLDYIKVVGMPGLTDEQPHKWYGHYYAVQAMYLAGGEHWSAWWPAAREDIVSAQSRAGSWSDSSFGDDYATAMALIVLQMPKRYLPIFQK